MNRKTNHLIFESLVRKAKERGFLIFPVLRTAYPYFLDGNYGYQCFAYAAPKFSGWSLAKKTKLPFFKRASVGEFNTVFEFPSVKYVHLHKEVMNEQ